MMAQVLSIIFFTLIGYLAVGIPLAVLPLYLHETWHFSSLITGLILSVHYWSTFFTRSWAGKNSDVNGPKKTLIVGLIGCGLSGVFLWTASACGSSLSLALPTILISRVLLGIGESFVATGATMWGIRRIGSQNAARAISWNGVATYSALAFGPMLGAGLNSRFGFQSVGVAIFVLVTIAFFIALAKKDEPATVRKRAVPLREVFIRVLPYGAALVSGSVGFGMISVFISLYFTTEHWTSPTTALALFGFFFVVTRLIFVGYISRIGGLKVASICLAVESLGIILLATSTHESMAFLGAALSGAGFSLVFPSLGAEAIARFDRENQGAAMGTYSIFIDLAFGVSALAGGAVSDFLGYRKAFLLAAFCALLGIALIQFLSLTRDALAQDPVRL